MKILLAYQARSSFVARDADLLGSRHQVVELPFSTVTDIEKLVHELPSCQLSLSWFGKVHALLTVLISKRLGKRAVVVAGGDDVAHEPGIQYGMFSFWWKKWCPLVTFRYADLILSVSDFNRRETIANAKADPSRVELLYHGFDATRLRPLDGVAKEPLVVTVGGVDWERLQRKGYELFVRAAAYAPQAQFALIGKAHDDSIEYLSAIAPPNVTFTGWLSDADLLQWLSRAKVYVQASFHEAFGCSLAEAMLCECVPVVSRRAALPEVVGDSGFYVDELRPEALAAQIRMALASNKGEQARERIVREFPLERRRERLLQLIQAVHER
jgi:glycosyltransferase involved in cell wall biosynthesis